MYRCHIERANKITIHTDSKKDLIITIEVKDENIIYNVKPVSGPEFETNYNPDNGVGQVLKMIEDEFSKDQNGGLHKVEKPKVKKETEYIQDNYEDDNIDEPITRKPYKISKSIDIRIIKSVLEDSYILSELDLKNLTIEELIRRMLVESRR